MSPSSNASVPNATSPSGDEQAVASFARHLAHDLNNFATVIRTYSELLMADLPEGSTRNDAAEIYRAADTLIAYLQRVTRFARAGTGRPIPQALLPTVRAVVDEFLEARDASPVRLVDGGADAPTHAVYDGEWLRDALRELITNARDASPGTHSIEVIMSQADDAGVRWAVIDVCDHGPGFSDALRGTPEAPFVTTKLGVRGAGFGLTLADAFAEANGGRLRRTREAGVTRVSLWLRVHE